MAKDEQQTLGDMVPKPSPDLLAKTERLETVRDDRMGLQTEKKELQEEVLALMHAEQAYDVTVASGRIAKRNETPAKEKVAFSTPKAEEG